jgi:hypothetical protein
VPTTIRSIHVNRIGAWQALAALLVFSGSSVPGIAATPSGEDVVVTTVQGDVQLTARGETRAVKPGTVIKPPATIRTGRDGAVELQQGRTRASIAADTEVEIPTLGVRGKFVERIVQPRGNVFYDVAPGTGRKLRVETPYLVAVIKGTQFNVAAHPESTTISLFEGRLEIWTPDESDVVQLNAGEIATRGRGDRGIRVLLMGSGETLRASNTAPLEGASARSSSAVDAGSLRAPTAELITDIDSIAARPLQSPVDASAVTLDSSLHTTSVELGDSKIEVGSAGVDADVRAGVDLGVVSVDTQVGAAIDLGAGSIETNVGASADLGIATIDTNIGAGVDLGAGTVDAGAALDANLAGVVDAGLAAEAAVDLGSVAVDAGVDAAVDLAGTTVDASLGAGVDASAGTVDLGATALVAETPVAVDAGVDLGSGTVDAGLTLGPLEVDLGLDLGTSEPAAAPATTEPNVVEEVIAPLRGLLGR